MQRARLAVALIGLAACGAAGAPASGRPSWIDRDDQSAAHATASRGASGAPATAPQNGADCLRAIESRDATRGGVNAPALPVQPPKGDHRESPLSVDACSEESGLAALDALGDRAPAGKLALRIARLAHHRGDDRAAQAMIARAAHTADEPEVHAGLAGLAGQLVIPTVDGKLIAVLLPLSGTYAGLGSELRLAIELAPAAGARWLFLDTHGTPDGAAAAVEAAHAKGAAGVLGPVGQREAIAAARVAALHGLPIALLAPADGADPAAGVFRAVTSTADEARAIAQLAAEDSFPTVAVFSPRDDVGKDASEAFVAEATRLGLQVTAQGSYDPTGGDVEPDVKAFLGLVPAQNPRLAAHLARHPKNGWTTFEPDIPYTLLYIPDRYDRAAIVAAFLPYYNVELRTTDAPDPERLARKHAGHVPQIVQLVGGAGWHHPSLPIRGGDAVQGALVVDDFAGELGGDGAQQFVAAFQARAHRPPSTAAAQAYDAAALIAAARAEVNAVTDSAPDPREALRGALAHAKLTDGACGPAAIGPDGELTRVPSVLEVQGEDLVLVP